ncbi:MAG: single-stranded-DNA-specific exonuclease RecJ [Clostridia bacterium]|nr:single-stranded-DNA-specific exonuclease RecJ [Clostridia bacterium]
MRRLISRAVPGLLEGVSPLLAPLLLARGVDTPDKLRVFLHPAAQDLHDPFLMPDMEKACRMIRETIDLGKHIIIYGDYDCDGVCASVIMLEALKSLGAHAEVYIPSRKEEGYGLNTAAMHKLAEKQYRLMITVDCGITAVEEIALAKSLGMNVILTDHHTPPDPLPAADAILHPQLGGYPCSSLCGAGTAYKLACALSGKQIIPTLPLCALATVADMVPLLGENRTLAALGLAAMADTSNIGLRALLRVSGLRTGEAVTGQQAGFLLAPRINACGRMETAQIALELLSTDDPVRAAELADTADGLNARRKSLENMVLEQANAQASALDLCTGHAIVIEGEGWESGVVGLAAGRLAEYYGYPTVILSREGDICVGSARSACGVDLYQALSACSDLFTRFGGHKQAAGLTLPAENVSELRIRLSDAVAKQLQGRTLMPETVYDGELRLTDITLDLISSLGMLEPFGTGNPAPVFLVRDVEALSARAVGSGGSHLKLTLGQDTCILDAIAFRMGTLASSMRGICSLAITPVANTFNGRTSPECRIEAIASMQRFFSRPANEDALAILQELAHLCRIDNFSGLPAQLEMLPAPQNDQGTLYLCRTAASAARITAAYPQLDILDDTQSDPRAYSAVWLCDVLTFPGPYRRVILCDGLLCPQEYAKLRDLLPQAEILAMPRSAELNNALMLLRFSIEELRAFYVALRKNGTFDRKNPRTDAMLRVLCRVGLTDETGHLQPAQPCDPAADSLFQLIQGGEP